MTNSRHVGFTRGNLTSGRRVGIETSQRRGDVLAGRHRAAKHEPYLRQLGLSSRRRGLPLSEDNVRPFSAMAMTAALVLPRTMDGITEASINSIAGGTASRPRC